MKSGRLLIVFVAALSVPVFAQQKDSLTSQTSKEQDELKRQTSIVATVLRDAINNGARRLADWAIQGGVRLTSGGSSIINSTPLPDGDVVVDVQIENVYGLALLRTVNNDPSRPVDPNRRLAAQQLVSGIAPARCDPSDPLTIDPESQYAECVRQSLIEGVLDTAKVLTVKDGQWFVVGVSPLGAVSNSAFANPSKRLILSIKGEDLRAYREAKITAEEAKKRIREQRF